jgi:hypothetical protein
VRGKGSLLRRTSVVTLVWAGLVLFLAVVLWVFWTPPDPWSYVVPGFVAGVLVLMAAAAWPTRPRPAEDETVVDLSFGTAAATVGLCLVLIGLAVGPWLWLIGAGVLLGGLGGLVREARSP